MIDRRTSSLPTTTLIITISSFILLTTSPSSQWNAVWAGRSDASTSNIWSNATNGLQLTSLVADLTCLCASFASQLVRANINERMTRIPTPSVACENARQRWLPVTSIDGLHEYHSTQHLLVKDHTFGMLQLEWPHIYLIS
jgi:hypothetical protein